jgi:hypothetical protein
MILDVTPKEKSQEVMSGDHGGLGRIGESMSEACPIQ